MASLRSAPWMENKKKKKRMAPLSSPPPHPCGGGHGKKIIPSGFATPPLSEPDNDHEETLCYIQIAHEPSSSGFLQQNTSWQPTPHPTHQNNLECFTDGSSGRFLALADLISNLKFCCLMEYIFPHGSVEIYLIKQQIFLSEIISLSSSFS